MTEVKAIDTVKCGGKFYVPGDTFECDAELAKDLIDRGLAESTASKAKPKAEPKAEKAEKPKKAKKAKQAAPAKKKKPARKKKG